MLPNRLFDILHMRRFISPALAALAGFLLLSLGAYAQTASMNLTGSVQSDAQQPLPGAAITVIHLPSGLRYAAASDATGRFAVPKLLAGGPYTIRVGEGGYRPQTVENIFLETGKTTTFNVVLNKIGANAVPAGRDRANRPATNEQAPNGTTLALAEEAVVGGPVLLTTLSTPAATPARPKKMPAAPVATVASEVSAAAPISPAVGAAAAPALPSPHSNRYPVRRPTRGTDPIVPGHYDTASGNYVYDTGALTTLRLAGGGAIAGVGINSTESNLYRFLTDPQTQVDTVDLTRGWFNFDRVYFTLGKATLTAQSVHQLRNIATLLRAYPAARIKLGGYTDSTGTYKVNKLLSEARARTAWASLVEMGISPARIDARGYGPRYAIASNSTDESRARNRRLSIKVLQK